MPTTIFRMTIRADGTVTQKETIYRDGDKIEEIFYAVHDEFDNYPIIITRGYPANRKTQVESAWLPRNTLNPNYNHQIKIDDLRPVKGEKKFILIFGPYENSNELNKEEFIKLLNINKNNFGTWLNSLSNITKNRKKQALASLNVKQKPAFDKTFEQLVNTLNIGGGVDPNAKGYSRLTTQLNGLKETLRNEGDSQENRMVIEKTKTLIESTLQSGAPMEPSEYHKAITKYQQEVSNLSLSQKILIATMMFLGALAGFIVGAVIGGVVSAGNPLAILAAGFTTAVIVGTSIGTAAGGGLGLLFSRVGVFKYDPVKAAAKEFVESIDDYRSAKSNNFP